MWLRVGAATDRGRVRDRNEDAYMVRVEQGLFVVCDGMGGAPAGDVASRMAIEEIARDLESSASAAPPADERLYLAHTAWLAGAVRRSNAIIYDRARQDAGHARMGTTLVGAWIRQHVAGVAHVGDSRAYLWHAERLEPLTRDHSLPEEQHVLVRVLGREPQVDVDLSEVPVQAGDYVLLCSDGLTRMVPDPELARAIGTLREPQRICDGLVAAANRNGGADNITVIVVEVAGGRWRRLWNAWKGSARRGHDADTDAAI